MFDFNLGDYLSKAGDWMKENPNQLAIGLDTIGSKIAPDNAFAGLGTYMGKSNIAASNEKEVRANREKFLQQFLQHFAGGNLTEPGKPGVSKITLTPGKDGKPPELTMASTVGNEEMAGVGGQVAMPSTSAPVTIPQPASQGGQNVSLGDMMNFPF